MKRARKRYRKWPLRKVLLYGIVCLFSILAAIAVINLESPKGATDAIKVEPKAGDAPATEPQPAASQVAVPAPPLPVPPTVASEVEPTHSPPAAGESDAAYLRSKGLLIPVQGVRPDQLRDSFLDGRSQGRQHLAIDIMAGQGTPVLAVADGKVLRLYESEKGGVMLYQQDWLLHRLLGVDDVVDLAEGLRGAGQNVGRALRVRLEAVNVGPGKVYARDAVG